MLMVIFLTSLNQFNELEEVIMITGIAFICGVVVGAVACWLVMRNNPAVAAQAEALTKEGEKIINK